MRSSAATVIACASHAVEINSTIAAGAGAVDW
jgi:hypothetical protein